MSALWRQIDDLHAALVPGYFRPVAPAAGAEAPLAGRLASDPHAAMLVAQAEGGAPIAGAVLVRIYDTPDDPAMVPRRRGHVEALVVDERHRRAGVGTALMEAATAWARERGAVEIVLTVWDGNAAAEAFYRRLGYRVISRALGKTL